MNYNQILEMGDKLREKNGGRYIGRTKLFDLLREMSHSYTTPVIREYAKVLKDNGYIKATDKGNWEIMR